ncbi:hypothetical protein BH10PSE10_BH10PSE10_18200 [soil metagenome]
MSDLLDTAVAAHGGWDRWQRLKTITAHISAGGAALHLKGWPKAFADTRVSIDPHRQHTEFLPFAEAGQRGIFEAGRTAIVTEPGKTAGERPTPRQAFAGHQLTTPWDAQHALYFGGYAMWTYLTTPFLFRLPGFQTHEIEPWDENGETWRRLKVTFPANVESHSTEQTFYFDASGILRRHDYSVEIMGGTSSANYASDPKEFGGIIYPTKRRVYAIGPGNQPLTDRVAIFIDVHDIQVT